jgi:hypothetical protein
MTMKTSGLDEIIGHDDDDDEEWQAPAVAEQAGAQLKHVLPKHPIVTQNASLDPAQPPITATVSTPVSQNAPLDPAPPPIAATVATPVSQSPVLETLTTVIAGAKPDIDGQKELDDSGTSMDINLPVDSQMMDIDTPTTDSRDLVDKSHIGSHDANQVMDQEAGESLIGIS